MKGFFFFKKSLVDKVREYIFKYKWKSFRNKYKIIFFIKEKCNKFDFIVMKNFCFLIDNINRMKR